MCQAVSVLHRFSLIHLDIKPDNFLLDDNNTALLSFFSSLDYNIRILLQRTLEVPNMLMVL